MAQVWNPSKKHSEFARLALLYVANKKCMIFRVTFLIDTLKNTRKFVLLLGTRVIRVPSAS